MLHPKVTAYMQNLEIFRYNLACTCSCLEITLFWVLPFGKEKIGFLYNFSSARQNELKIKRLILSRRSASSESSPFSKAILKVEFRELYSPPHNLCPEDMFCGQNLLFCGQNYVTSITDRFCPRSGGKLFSGGSERHKE